MDSPQTPTDPIFREVDGRVEAEWPEPCAISYLVSTELLRAWVDQENERRDLRAALAVGEARTTTLRVENERLRSVLRQVRTELARWDAVERVIVAALGSGDPERTARDE